MNWLTSVVASLVLLSLPCAVMADDEARKVSFNNHFGTCHSFKKGDNRFLSHCNSMVWPLPK